MERGWKENDEAACQDSRHAYIYPTAPAVGNSPALHRDAPTSVFILRKSDDNFITRVSNQPINRDSLFLELMTI
jgi:hypothetical protein